MNKITLTLLGDSVLDNAIYVDYKKSVFDLLKKRLGDEVVIYNLAKDGSRIDDVLKLSQKAIPKCTDIVLSVGGNDALRLIPVLAHQASTIDSALKYLFVYVKTFREKLNQLLSQLSSPEVSIHLLTIYNSIPNLPDSHKMIVAIFNDVITEEANRYGLNLIDLRYILTRDSDYSSLSALEPSEVGGKKITLEIIKHIKNTVPSKQT